MSRLHFSSAARKDMTDIFDYIAMDNPRAARSFLDKLKVACQRLSQFPDMGVIRDELAPGVRCIPFASYLIFYRRVEHGVEVIRVLHGSRDHLGLVH